MLISCRAVVKPNAVLLPKRAHLQLRCEYTCISVYFFFQIQDLCLICSALQSRAIPPDNKQIVLKVDINLMKTKEQYGQDVNPLHWNVSDMKTSE